MVVYKRQGRVILPYLTKGSLIREFIIRVENLHQVEIFRNLVTATEVTIALMLQQTSLEIICSILFYKSYRH